MMISTDRNVPHQTRTTLKDWLSPYTIGAGIILVPLAITWGVYLETCWEASIQPLGNETLSYYLGVLAYSQFSLFIALLCGAVLYQGRKQHLWHEWSKHLYYLGIFIGILSLMSGFEYFFLLDWKYWNPVPYILIKGLFAGLTAVFCIRILHMRNRNKRKKTASNNL